MKHDAAVEAGPGHAHLYRHRETLQLFIGAVTDEVNSDDLLPLADTDRLHRADHAKGCKGISHRRKAAFVDGHEPVAIALLARLVFTEPNGCDGWMNRSG